MANDSSSTAGKLEALEARREAAVDKQLQKAIARQHPKNKLTARERIELLCDPDSFVELDELVRHQSHHFEMFNDRPYTDGVVTGYATIDGRQVMVFSQDFSIMGGSLGEAAGLKIIKIMHLAASNGCPIVGIHDSGGARIQEGVASLAMFGEIFRLNTELSGVVPQVSLILGPCAGGSVYSPALTDFTVMVDDTSYMFITGPEVIKTVTGEDVAAEDLGGSRTHTTKSGVAHHRAPDEQSAMNFVRDLLSYLPANNLQRPPAYPYQANMKVGAHDLEMDELIPDSSSQPYDMHVLVAHVLDDDQFLEIHADWAPNIMVGFGRVEGHPVGIIANQPMHLAGTLDIEASEKASRFVRTCDAFNLPVLTFVDVPGFLPGVDQEFGGIIRHGAKLIYAYAEATVPLITVITRKAYGGAYVVMGSKHLGADLNLAWPTAQIAVMGAQGAINILFRREIAAAKDSAAEAGRRIGEYEKTLDNPYIAAERGWVDAVIRPSETRGQISKALRMLRDKRVTQPQKKHGNIPL